MKVNKNFIRCITSICVVVIYLSLFVFPVSAKDVNGIDYFDFDKYATYLQLPDSNQVEATVTLPDSWYVTQAGGFDNSLQYGRDVNISYSGLSVEDWININSSPLGAFSWDLNNGHAHAFDLTLMPKDFIFYGTLDVNLSFTNMANELSNFEVIATTLDVNGNMLDMYFLDVYPDLVQYSSGAYGEIQFVFDSSLSIISPEAVALVFDYNIGFMVPKNSDHFDIEIHYQPFTIEFSMDEAFINNRNQAIIRDGISNIEKELGDIDNKLDSAINGTPEQNQQAQDAVGGLNSSTDKLGQLGDTMASVDKPTIDSNKISAGSLVPQTSLVVLSSPFQALWENKQLLAMLTIVVTLVLVSWVFFGKKA